MTRYRELGRSARLLRVFGKSGGTAGALSLRVFRSPNGSGLSDATCTALQLANFWQDVTIDQQKDRVYLPLDLLAQHNYTVEDLFAQRFDERFRGIMQEAVDRARELFLKGCR